MTEQPQPAIGTVAEEAARLIEAMATMARSSTSQDPSRYAGGPAQEPVPPDAPPAAGPADDPEPAPSAGACSACGGERDGPPIACRL